MFHVEHRKKALNKEELECSTWNTPIVVQGFVAAAALAHVGGHLCTYTEVISHFVSPIEPAQRDE